MQVLIDFANGVEFRRIIPRSCASFLRTAEFQGVNTLPKDSGDPTQRILRLSDEPTPTERISPEVVQSLYEVHGREILAFLVGVLRDPIAAHDVSQVVFRRLLEVGHTARLETIKGWLFTVAMREALEFRRRSIRKDRHESAYSQQLEKAEWHTPPDILISREEAIRLQGFVNLLPKDQQYVVRKRIQENTTFAVIAEELNVPLNTVLTRMRLALEKLRKWLNDKSGNDNVGQ